MIYLNLQKIQLLPQGDAKRSFLALGVEDSTLRKLESYRLRKLGYSAEQIAQTLDFSRSHLYHMWKEFEKQGTPALIKKNWGATTRKLTTTKEAQILRAKAPNPHRSDRDLAQEFDLDRRTVYGLLKEHGLQDLHRVLVGDQANDTPENICASSQLEVVPCQPALLLTLLPYISTTGALNALSGLGLRSPFALYSDQQLQLSLLLMAASGVLRLSHINDLPVSGWAIPLSTSRRPCSDTLDHYLQQVIDLDEQGSQQSVVERLGMIRPGGLIEQAQLESLRLWVCAGLTDSQIWNFDGHVIEYTGSASLDKTKHGTKARAAGAIKRFTISNGLCVLDYYCPAHTTFADACRHLVRIANQTLGPDHQIRFLAFDREGWDKELLDWLKNDAHVNPITWVKRTSKTVKQLNSIPDSGQSSRASSISGLNLSKTSDKREVSTPFCSIQSPINGTPKSDAPVIAKSYLSESDQQQEGAYQVADTISNESQDEPLCSPIACEVAETISTGMQNEPVSGSLANLGQKVVTVVNRALNKLKQ